MTIATQASQSIALGNGVSQTFDFDFVADAAEFIEVIYTDTTGAQTTLSPSQYTLVITAPAAGQIWGIGGSVTYPIIGSPIANGTSLTIQRVIPYTQVISISNQGDFAPQVIEEMGDTLEMQIQQVASRTGQIRGTWITDTDYNFGDLVIDGANGSNTGNLYVCAIANTSDVWATDLAAGDWSLVISASTGSAPLPLSVAVGGTGTNLSATGGTSQVVKQITVGGNFSVGQLAASDLSNGTTGTGAVVLVNNATLTGTTTVASFTVNELTASSAVATNSLKRLVSVTNTGSGNNVLATSPTLSGTTTASAFTIDSLRFNTTIGIVGTTTNNDAATGSVGEYITNTTNTVSLVSATAKTLTSISLTAGDWDVWGEMVTNPAGGTTGTLIQGAINTVDNTMPSSPAGGAMLLMQYAIGAGAQQIFPVGRTRISIASTTTIYLIGRADFAVSTMTANGFIAARRVR